MKRLHWASSSGAATSLSFGELLYEHAREVDPNFPSARYSHEDWEHHLRLKALLDRAEAAFETR